MQVRISLGGYQLALRPGESLIGRTRACQLRIDDPTVSRRHARMLLVRELCTIADLGSRNGVKVNGEKISDARVLADGDLVAVGSFEFTVNIDQSAPEEHDEVEETTHSPLDSDYQVPRYRTCIHCREMLKQGQARCPHCGAEQVQSMPTLQLWADPHGRRSAYRHSLKLRALYVSPWMTIEGEISDISLGGAFFATQLVDATGTACDLILFPDDESEVVRLGAEVVRVQQSDGQPQGVGLRFTKMTSAAQSWLISIVASRPQHD